MRSRKEAWRWMHQAESDLEFARLAVREGFFAQACFTAQQAGEKAVKALHYAGGERLVFGHSILELMKKIVGVYKQLEQFLELGGLLDQYYVPTRYPNGLPDGIPSEVYSEKQAKEAVEGVAGLITRIKELLPKDEGE